MAKVLVLGCGLRSYRREGWVNVDKAALPGVDARIDLNRFPWPFADESFDQVIAEDVLEHLDNIVRVMEEIWRVLKPGCDVTITGPRADHPQAWDDPTHRRLFTERSFDLFDPATIWGRKYGFYTPFKFKKIKVERGNGYLVFVLRKVK